MMIFNVGINASKIYQLSKYSQWTLYSRFYSKCKLQKFFDFGAITWSQGLRSMIDPAFEAFNTMISSSDTVEYSGTNQIVKPQNLLFDQRHQGPSIKSPTMDQTNATGDLFLDNFVILKRRKQHTRRARLSLKTVQAVLLAAVRL